MSDSSSEQLVQAAQQGDRKAFEQLCEQHRSRLLRVIRCRLDPRLRTRVDESDIVQETLALASRDLDSYRRQAGVPFFAWLRQIAWRRLSRASEKHIVAERRTVMRERHWGGDYSRPALAEALAIHSTPSGKLAEKELVTHIGTALHALSDADREVLVLRFLEGLNTAEAAAVVGISGVALRQRLTRALKRLGMLLPDDRDVRPEGCLHEGTQPTG